MLESLPNRTKKFRYKIYYAVFEKLHFPLYIGSVISTSGSQKSMHCSHTRWQFSRDTRRTERIIQTSRVSAINHRHHQSQTAAE